MAAGSMFFKDQLCRQNVQVPVILRLEDFGIKLKMDAVTYIIEFVYRGEVRVRFKREDGLKDRSFHLRHGVVDMC